MLQTLVRDYSYVHLGVGLLGNAMFFLGSVLFFEAFEAWHHLAVWLFVLGSLCMLLGSIGRAAKDLYEAAERDRSA